MNASDANAATSLDVVEALETLWAGGATSAVVACFRDQQRALAVMVGMISAAVEEKCAEFGLTPADWVAAARSSAIAILFEDDPENGSTL